MHACTEPAGSCLIPSNALVRITLTAGQALQSDDELAGAGFIFTLRARYPPLAGRLSVPLRPLGNLIVRGMRHVFHGVVNTVAMTRLVRRALRRRFV